MFSFRDCAQRSFHSPARQTVFLLRSLPWCCLSGLRSQNATNVWEWRTYIFSQLHLHVHVCLQLFIPKLAPSWRRPTWEHGMSENGVGRHQQHPYAKRSHTLYFELFTPDRPARYIHCFACWNRHDNEKHVFETVTFVLCVFLPSLVSGPCSSIWVDHCCAPLDFWLRSPG